MNEALREPRIGQELLACIPGQAFAGGREEDVVTRRIEPVFPVERRVGDLAIAFLGAERSYLGGRRGVFRGSALLLLRHSAEYYAANPASSYRRALVFTRITRRSQVQILPPLLGEAYASGPFSFLR